MTAASNRSDRSAYLPVVPEGWAIGLTLVGAEGSVKVAARLIDGYEVTFMPTGTDEVRTRNADTLRDAFKIAVEGARALDKNARDVAALAEARTMLIDALGEAPETPAP